MTGILRSRADLGAETQREWGDPFRERTLTIEKGTFWDLDMEQKLQGCSEVEPKEEKAVQSRPGFTSIKFLFQHGTSGLSQSRKLEDLAEIRKWLPIMCRMGRMCRM